MSDTEYVLKPKFSGRRKRKSRHPLTNKEQEELVESGASTIPVSYKRGFVDGKSAADQVNKSIESSEAGEDVDPGSIPGWSITGFFQKNKTLLIVVIAVLIILIIIALWILKKEDDANAFTLAIGPNTGGPVQGPPIPMPGPPGSMPGGGGAPPPGAIPMPAQDVHRSGQRVRFAPPGATPVGGDSILAPHERIVNTVDDKELDKYISQDDKEMNKYINAEDAKQPELEKANSDAISEVMEDVIDDI